MNTLTNIFNESYGYSVAVNNDYVIVGNPTTREYDPCTGIGVVGEVQLIKRTRYDNNYTIEKTYVQKPAQFWGNLYTYTSESGSAGDPNITSSMNYESGSLTNQDHTCSYINIEHNTSQVLLSRFGHSVDISDYDMVISNTEYSESFFGNLEQNNLNTSLVNIYTIFDRDQSTTCLSESKDNTTFSDSPRCVITGSSSDEFGQSVSITNEYLAVGSPNYTDGSGSVYVYKYDGTCGYDLIAHLSSSTQSRFGYSVSLDKKDGDKLIVGTDNPSNNEVYIYKKDSNDNWNILQSLTHNTSSTLFKIGDNSLELYPVSQSNDRYGYSVDIYDKIAVVGAPNDLVYYEYSGSDVVRERGSAYVYTTDIGCGNVSSEYNLFEKLYGTTDIFKDNLFGYSVSLYENNILIGSPKPYFPFSSLYLSSSINRYNKDLKENDFGVSTYNGQTILYTYTSNSSSLSLVTTSPISYRKKFNESFSAFGHSVDISNEHLAIGSPILLNDDRYLESPLILEESGSTNVTCSSNDQSVEIFEFLVEDTLSECNQCDSSSYISLMADQPSIDEINGKSFIYNFIDLKNNHTVGNVFYNNNKLVINNEGSILNDILKDPIDLENSYMYMDYKSELKLNEQQYICTIEPGEFNTSTNQTSLTENVIDYGILDKENFDFQNLDIILRYINYKITTDKSEKWWDVFVEGDEEESILTYYHSKYTNFETNKLTDDLKCILSTKDFDINDDGAVSILDGILLWKYFIGLLTIKNYQSYITINSKRTVYDDIIKFIDEKTGKLNETKIKTEFFEYSYSSSLDPTGSFLAPYITTVGLYSGGDLVATAKTAHPIKNTGEIPINIVLKWYN